MSRLQTMARFAEPTDEVLTIYSQCWYCGEDLVEGDEVEIMEEYIFCSTDCLIRNTKTKVLGEDY